jgi:hypothetical protein
MKGGGGCLTNYVTRNFVIYAGALIVVLLGQ